MVKRLIAAYRLIKTCDKYKAELDNEGSWTQDEAYSLQHCQAIHKLVDRLNNAGMKAAVEACQPSTTGDHRRGMAYGILLTVNLIRQHFHVSEQVKSDNSVQSDAEQPVSEYAF